jgi:hypothetical protein
MNEREVNQRLFVDVCHVGVCWRRGKSSRSGHDAALIDAGGMGDRCRAWEVAVLWSGWYGEKWVPQFWRRVAVVELKLRGSSQSQHLREYSGNQPQPAVATPSTIRGTPRGAQHDIKISQHDAFDNSLFFFSSSHKNPSSKKSLSKLHTERRVSRLSSGFGRKSPDAFFTFFESCKKMRVNAPP